MVELKRLFAQMLASDRKYLNPSATIEILKQSFSPGAGLQAQQMSNDQQVGVCAHSSSRIVGL